jgi:hypothetical protein
VAVAQPTAQRTTALALGPGRLQALRLRTVATRLPTAALCRPKLEPSDQRSLDQSWAGFEASIDLARLCGRGGWRPRRWRVFVYTRAGVLRRRRAAFDVDEKLIGTHDLPASDGVRARAMVSAVGGVTVDIVTNWTQLEMVSSDGVALDLAVRLHTRAGPAPTLRLVRRSDGLDLNYRLAEPDDAARRSARVPVRELCAVPPSLELSARGGGDEVWDAWLDGAGAPLPLALAKDEAGARWHTGRDSVTLIRNGRGDAALVAHRPTSPEAPEAGPTIDESAELERTTSPVSLRRA